MKKRLAVLALLLTCCFAIVGCQDPNESTDNGKVTVTFWHTMGTENQEILKQIIKRFEAENEGIKINHVQKGDYDGLRDAVTKSFAAGEEPSLTYSYPDHVSVYRNGGHVVDLLQYINDPVLGEGFDKDDFIPEYYNEGIVEEEGDTFLFSLPYAKSTEVMFYNKTFFDTNKLTVPTTWAELKTVSEKIRGIVDAEGENDIVPFGYDSESNLFITMTEQLGSEYSTNDGEFKFVNDENKEFVTDFKEMYDNKLITTKAMLSGAYTSTKFTEQKLYMSIGSTGGTRYNIPDQDGETGELAFEVGVAAVPQVDVTNPKVIQQGPNITMLTSSEKEQEASWKFLKFLLLPENNVAYALQTGYSPVTKSAQETAAFQAILEDDDPTKVTASDVHRLVREQCKKYEDSHAYYVSPAFDGSSKARTEVGSLITSVFAGTATVEEAFDTALRNCQF